ncbi:MAG: sulfotransferase [Flavobacteriaceae bacterium]|nr:sulfotransferase [Flavobacteriaceae bacterium]
MGNLFVIPGFQKTGSTTLYEILSQSNEIFAPTKFKDFHFLEHGNPNSSYVNEYLNFHEKVGLNCAVNYVLSYDSIKNILNFFPESKFILILRDPIKRAISAFLYFQRMGVENRPFENVVYEELNYGSMRLKREQLLLPGLYFKHIQNNLLSQIPGTRVKCFLFEDIFLKDKIYIEPILDFMGVSKFEYDNKMVLNSRGHSKFPMVNKILFQRNAFKSMLAKVVPLQIRTSFKSWIFNHNVISGKDIDVSLNEEIFKDLKEFFYEDSKCIQNYFDLLTLEKWFNNDY